MKARDKLADAISDGRVSEIDELPLEFFDSRLTEERHGNMFHCAVVHAHHLIIPLYRYYSKNYQDVRTRYKIFFALYGESRSFSPIGLARELQLKNAMKAIEQCVLLDMCELILQKEIEAAKRIYACLPGSYETPLFYFFITRVQFWHFRSELHETGSSPKLSSTTRSQFYEAHHKLCAQAATLIADLSDDHFSWKHPVSGKNILMVILEMGYTDIAYYYILKAPLKVDLEIEFLLSYIEKNKKSFIESGDPDLQKQVIAKMKEMGIAKELIEKFLQAISAKAMHDHEQAVIKKMCQCLSQGQIGDAEAICATLPRSQERPVFYFFLTRAHVSSYGVTQETLPSLLTNPHSDSQRPYDLFCDHAAQIIAHMKDREFQWIHPVTLKSILQVIVEHGYGKIVCHYILAAPIDLDMDVKAIMESFRNNRSHFVAVREHDLLRKTGEKLLKMEVMPDHLKEFIQQLACATPKLPTSGVLHHPSIDPLQGPQVQPGLPFGCGAG